MDVAVRDCGGRGRYANSIGEGTNLGFAEAVLQGTTHHGARSEIGYGDKASRRLSLKTLQEKGFWRRAREIRSVPRHAEFLRWRKWFHAADFDPRWRSKLDLGSGEPFDDLHGSATLGTAIKIKSIFC